jgi:hypothetical protein
MKKQVLAFILLMAAVQAMFGSDTLQSKIIFYREANFQGSAISYKVLANDTFVVKLKNNSFFVYPCKPGEYDLNIRNWPDAKIHLKAEADKTYYLRFGIRMGFWTSSPELILVDSISAYPAIHNTSIHELNAQNVPLIRPKNRIGINFNLGGGFENTSMLTTSDGKESSLSFGGGYAFGVKYGHEFTRHFDLATDLIYQFSSLRPYLSNADMTFSRVIISATPALILPINGGDMMRLKLGAGPDYYFASVLSIDCSKITGGFNDTWHYNSSIGFHVSVVYEWNVSDSWSFNYGLKWYNVGYDFKSGGKYYPTTNKFESPDGSGIDFLFGFYYHF